MSEPHPEERAPLGFKLIVAAAAFYLLVRLAQGVVWLAQRIL